jgi:hypothetical protein
VEDLLYFIVWIIFIPVPKLMGKYTICPILANVSEMQWTSPSLWALSAYSLLDLSVMLCFDLDVFEVFFCFEIYKIIYIFIF